MNHFMNNGKEYLKKNKVRQYRSNQGRSPQQIESNYKVMSWALTGLLVTLIIVGLCGVFGLEL